MVPTSNYEAFFFMIILYYNVFIIKTNVSDFFMELYTPVPSMCPFAMYCSMFWMTSSLPGVPGFASVDVLHGPLVDDGVPSGGVLHPFRLPCRTTTQTHRHYIWGVKLSFRKDWRTIFFVLNGSSTKWFIFSPLGKKILILWRRKNSTYKWQ